MLTLGSGEQSGLGRSRVLSAETRVDKVSMCGIECGRGKKLNVRVRDGGVGAVNEITEIDEEVDVADCGDEFAML